MNPEKTNPLETIARLITIFTVICYLIGVFTVNSYLYHLGISSLSSPLKPRFIYTGIVVLSSLGFSFFFPMLFVKKWQSTRPHWWQQRIFLIIVFPALSYFFINYLFVMLVNNLGVITLKPSLSLIIVFCHWIGSFITGAAISLFLQVVFPVFSHQAGIYDWKVPRNEYTRFLACFLLIPVLSSYITFFGHRVYPMIPEQFGGGQPRIIQLWLKPSNAQETKRDLTLRNSLTSVTSKITKALLFDEEEYYLIGLYTEDSHEGISEGETKDGKILETIFQIDRDLVAGIKLTPDRSRYLLSYLLDLVNSVFYRN